MGFKLKTKGELFGINEELSEFGRPVFEKDMGISKVIQSSKKLSIIVKK